MRLFCKHLSCSIRRRPAQPILLVLVLLLAVAVCTTSVNFFYMMQENQDLEEQATLGKGEYRLQTDSFSDERFFSEESVIQVLPEDTEVCGVLSFYASMGEEEVFSVGCATHFSKIADFFDIVLLSFLPVCEEDLGSSVLLGATFADENGLALGDTIELNVFGVPSEFCVAGILKSNFLATYSVVIDYQALYPVLRKQFPSYAVLQDELTLANTVYISPATDDISIETILVERFPDLILVPLEDAKSASLRNLDSIILILVILCCIFVIIIIYCCFCVLSIRREEETVLLKNVGANSLSLRLLSSYELCFYWLIGGSLGILLSDVIIGFLADVGNLTYCSAVLHWQAVLLGLFGSLFSSQCSLLLFSLIERKKKRGIRKHPSRPRLSERKTNGLLFGTLFCFLLPFILLLLDKNSSHNVIYGCISFLPLAVFVFLFGKNLLLWISERTKNKRGKHFLYALKNASRVETLRNTAGLTSVSFLLAFALFFLLLTGECGVTSLETVLQGDYLVMNAADQAEGIAAMPSVEGVYAMRKDKLQIVGGIDELIDVYGVSDIAVFSDDFPLDVLPKENEIFMPDLVAKHGGYALGDTVSLKIGHQVYSFVYTKAIPTNLSVTLINLEDNGIPYNMLVVKGSDGTDREVLHQDILYALRYQSATVVPKESVMKEWTSSISKILLCVQFIVAFCACFAVIGIGNSIASGYISRQEEFRCFLYAGMTKQDVRRMVASELILTFLVGLVLFFLFVALVLFIIYKICFSFTLNVFWNFYGFL